VASSPGFDKGATNVGGAVSGGSGATRVTRIAGAAPCAGVLAALALLVSGCGGGGSSPQVASLGSGTTTTTGGANAGGSSSSAAGGSSSGTSSQAAPRSGGQFSLAGGGAHMMQFASCMRSHGLPGFPDPNAQGVITGNAGSGLDPGSPQFQKAQQSCAKFLPNGGTPSPAQQALMRRQALAFSACMRSHGLPKFPDPQFGAGGRVALRIGSSSGIDPRSPQFQAAQKTCGSLLPGRIKGGPAPPGASTAVAGGGK
jgi:hypothetical protein